ncbi:CRISPR-associated ring nuclease [Thermogemmatispora tikiterensis]|uniref:Uncharacterized protein n=1 Tax=Thermogemmatispora tikiterensis TaxID=1825093 RepID=A0A328VD75_9CHLR|nr:CRISPR-associated ring nuclease [Thermogemmatispora tikiterensis]RAQ95708.1 hypothetical protein A4R35_09195 [Thermogemmatispora tikiterensis]
MDKKHVLIATLGGQPQIVTFTLDLLLAKGFPISEVVVVHPATREDLRLSKACKLLASEFSGNYYRAAQKTISFSSQALELNGQPIEDIQTDPQIDASLDFLQRLLGDYKRRDYVIHLSVSGGRRLITLLAISVAIFNFGRHDHIWHLYTPWEVQKQVDEGRQMHIPPDTGHRLIEVPLPTIGPYLYDPSLSFRAIYEQQRQKAAAEDERHCRTVLRQATPAQQRVLRAFAKGLRPKQVAEELHLSETTVHSHKTVLLSLCRQAWELPEQDPLDYHFLREKFARIVEQEQDDDTIL